LPSSYWTRFSKSLTWSVQAIIIKNNTWHRGRYKSVLIALTPLCDHHHLFLQMHLKESKNEYPSIRLHSSSSCKTISLVQNHNLRVLPLLCWISLHHYYSMYRLGHYGKWTRMLYYRYIIRTKKVTMLMSKHEIF